MKPALTRATTRISSFVLAYVLFPLLAFAESGSGSNTSGAGSGSNTTGAGSGSNTTGNITTFENPLKANSLSEFLTTLLDGIIKIAFPFLVLAVIYTGFLFVKAQGNPEELKTAKNAFLWTVIGALVILAASAISALIQGTVAGITK